MKKVLRLIADHLTTDEGDVEITETEIGLPFSEVGMKIPGCG